jgi:hypothetical protein
VAGVDKLCKARYKFVVQEIERKRERERLGIS